MAGQELQVAGVEDPVADHGLGQNPSALVVAAVDPLAQTTDTGSGQPVAHVARGRGLSVTRTGLVLPSSEPLAGADLRSGDRVTLVVDPASPGEEPRAVIAEAGAGGPARSRTWCPAAVLKLLTGPASPAAIEIPFGEVTIGRGEDNDVVVPDGSMSRHHASIRVDDASVEIADLQSANGVVIDGKPREGSVSLLPGTRALLGRTWIEVEHLGRPQGLGDLGHHTVEFNRPPRLVEPYQPRTFALPAPPDHPPRQRIPKLAALAPLLGYPPRRPDPSWTTPEKIVSPRSRRSRRPLWGQPGGSPA